MQYYILEKACDTKETGPAYPQIQKWKKGYDKNKSDSYYSYYRASMKGTFPDFEPDLNSLVMHGWAKPTDLVSSFLSDGFIVSAKLKLLFQQFHLPPIHYYPAKVIYKKNDLIGYYFMHIISDYTDFVDYSKSSFIASGNFNSNPAPIILTSKKEYIEESEKLKEDFFVDKLPYRSIKSEKICFNAGFDQSLEGFKIGPFNINFYISENLKDALIKDSITGCDIKLTDDVTI